MSFISDKDLSLFFPSVLQVSRLKMKTRLLIRTRASQWSILFFPKISFSVSRLLTALQSGF